MALSLRSFAKIFRVLRPRIEIGGLEISDSGITFLSLDPETHRPVFASLKLPYGVVVEGKVVNAAGLGESLVQIHKQISKDRSKKIPVVVTLSDANIYTQQFTLPPLQAANLDEAARLNLQVISPIEFAKAYVDWQKVESSSATARDVEILASFVEKSIIDAFYRVLNDSQFVPVAIEQRAASLARVMKHSVPALDPSKPHFILHVSGDGIGFSILKNGHLYFNRFTSWASITHQGGQREISFKDFSGIIVEESHRMINFYSSRFNDLVTSISIIAPGLEPQVRQIVESNLSLKIEPITLKEYAFESSWFVSLGAALRGLMSRSSDTEISLAPEGTETQFLHSQVLSFTAVWRNVIAVVFAVIMFSYIGGYLSLESYFERVASDFQSAAAQYNVSRLTDLKSKAAQFNGLVSRALNAQKQRTQWSLVLDGIYGQAGSSVSIDRVYAQSLDLPVVINARAPSSNEAVEFKNRLATLPFLTGVDLPLASITPGANPNEVVFMISFRIVSGSL